MITGEKLGRSIFSRNTSIRHADSVAAEDVNIRWDAEIKRSEEITAKLFVALRQTGSRLPGSDNFQKRRRLSIMGTPIFRKVMLQAWRLGGNSGA